MFEIVLAAGLSIFLLLSAMMSVSLYMGRSGALEMSRKMGETVSGFARDASEQNARQHLWLRQKQERSMPNGPYQASALTACRTRSDCSCRKRASGTTA